MITANTITPTELELPDQHLVLHDVSWDFYEHVLEEIGDARMRVTYSDGSIEIMAPLQLHDAAGAVIAELLAFLTFDRKIPRSQFGSSTFRRKDMQKGLEPDRCFYFRENANKVRGMKRFDPLIHPAPDLAIEIDITRSSIPRQPVYAALGVPELWRFDNRHLTVLLLTNSGEYAVSTVSKALPFLPMDPFEGFVWRMLSEDQVIVLEDFRDWVRTLP